MMNVTQRKQIFQGTVFILFLGLMPLITGCGSSGSSSSGGNNNGGGGTNNQCNVSGGRNFNVSGFDSQTGSVLQNLASQLPSGQIKATTKIVSAAADSQHASGTGAYDSANDVITVYGTNLDYHTAELAMMQGVGQYQYTQLSQAAQAQVATDASNANAFFQGAKLPTVTAQQLFGQSYSTYMADSNGNTTLVYQEYPTGSYGSPFQGGIPIPGDDSWLISEPLLVASAFVHGDGTVDYFTLGACGNLSHSPNAIKVNGDLNFGGDYAIKNGEVYGVPVQGFGIAPLKYPAPLPPSFDQFFSSGTQSMSSAPSQKAAAGLALDAGGRIIAVSPNAPNSYVPVTSPAGLKEVISDYNLPKGKTLDRTAVTQHEMAPHGLTPAQPQN